MWEIYAKLGPQIYSWPFKPMAPASSTCIVNCKHRPQTQTPNHGLVWPVIRVTIFTVSYSNIGICKWMCKCYGREVWISLVYFSQCLSVLVFSKKRNARLMQLALGFALKKLKLVKSNHQYNSCKQTLNTLGGLI